MGVGGWRRGPKDFFRKSGGLDRFCPTPFAKMLGETMKNNIVEQMELGFTGSRLRMVPCAREQRRRRAAWWFSRMRQVVDRALDWQESHAPRPEQTWLAPQ